MGRVGYRACTRSIRVCLEAETERELCAPSSSGRAAEARMWGDDTGRHKSAGEQRRGSHPARRRAVRMRRIRLALGSTLRPRACRIGGQRLAKRPRPVSLPPLCRLQMAASLPASALAARYCTHRLRDLSQQPPKLPPASRRRQLHRTPATRSQPRDGAPSTDAPGPQQNSPFRAYGRWQTRTAVSSRRIRWTGMVPLVVALVRSPLSPLSFGRHAWGPNCR